MYSAAKEGLNANETHPFWWFLSGARAVSKFPSLPSQLCKCHCCTTQNGAIFGRFPNWAFSALASRHEAITFAAHNRAGKNAYKSGRMPEGSELVVRPFCFPSASLLPPFCLRYGNDKRLGKRLIYRAITDL